MRHGATRFVVPKSDPSELNRAQPSSTLLPANRPHFGSPSMQTPHHGQTTMTARRPGCDPIISHPYQPYRPYLVEVAVEEASYLGNTKGRTAGTAGTAPSAFSRCALFPHFRTVLLWHLRQHCLSHDGVFQTSTFPGFNEGASGFLHIPGWPDRRDRPCAVQDLVKDTLRIDSDRTRIGLGTDLLLEAGPG